MNPRTFFYFIFFTLFLPPTTYFEQILINNLQKIDSNLQSSTEICRVYEHPTILNEILYYLMKWNNNSYIQIKFIFVKFIAKHFFSVLFVNRK
jgi:hypothetical protein